MLTEILRISKRKPHLYWNDSMTGCSVCGKPLLGLPGLEFRLAPWMKPNDVKITPLDCHSLCLRANGDLGKWTQVAIDYYMKSVPEQIVSSCQTAIALVNSAADRCDIYSTEDGETGFSANQLPPTTASDDCLEFLLCRNSYLNTRDPDASRHFQHILATDGFLPMSVVLQAFALDRCYDMNSYSILSSGYQIVPDLQREWSQFATRCQMHFKYTIERDSALVARVAMPLLKTLGQRYVTVRTD